ncbi:MAG: phage tail assembly chaperone [Pseudomonadota bacterium]
MGLAPEAFWRLTPTEWSWLTAHLTQVEPLRASLKKLCRHYPDDTYGTENLSSN